MAKNDSGDWCLDSADPVKMSIRERLNTLLTPPDPGVIRVMEDEAAFVMSVHGKLGDAPFTDRRPIPGRNRDKP